MTQGIQFSTMLTSADSALKPAPMQAEGDAAQSGFGFGAVLGELVQPATNSQSDTVLRKLPAGISLLSGVSQAIAAATDGDLTEAMLSEAGQDSDLTSSILAQLALNGAAAHSSSGAQRDLRDGEGRDMEEDMATMV